MGFITLSGPQGQSLATLATFYFQHREHEPQIQIDGVFGHHTSAMSERDAKNHDGPFKGMMRITCSQSFQGCRRTTDMVIVAPDGEELHLTVR